MPDAAAKSRLKLACVMACAMLVAVSLAWRPSHLVVKGDSQTVIVRESNLGSAAIVSQSAPQDAVATSPIIKAPGSQNEDPNKEDNKESSTQWEQKKHGWMSVAVYSHFNPGMYHRTLGSLRNRGQSTTTSITGHSQ